MVGKKPTGPVIIEVEFVKTDGTWPPHPKKRWWQGAPTILAVLLLLGLALFWPDSSPSPKGKAATDAELQQSIEDGLVEVTGEVITLQGELAVVELQDGEKKTFYADRLREHGLVLVVGEKITWVKLQEDYFLKND